MSSLRINLVVFLLTHLVWRHSNVQAAVDPATSQAKDYEDKVCNSEPTCSLLPTVPNLGPDKHNFPWRDCMCDAECSEYDDCCPDSQHVKKPKLNTPPKTYHCPAEAKVYMVVSCLPDFSDERIKAYCAKALKPLETTNFALTVPVTNIAKRITYANAYCALCNKDQDFTPWTLASACGEPAKEALEKRIMSVQKETSTTSPAKNAAPSTVKPNNNRLNINIHLNPTAFSGKKDPSGGFNKTITIPTFTSLGAKLANKTIGSDTGFFGVKTSSHRRKRETSDLGSIDYYKWVRKLDEIMKVVKYDSSVRELVARFENTTLVCQLGSKLPDTLNKVTRPCVPNLISECPDNESANKVCQSYFRLVYDTNTKIAYRNIDCAQCNGVDRKNATLKGCLKGTRTSAQSLWGAEGKGNPNNEACEDPALADRFC